MKNPLHKIVLITGATAGIGRATARLFAKRGYDLIITGRRGEKLEHMAQKYERKYAIKVLPLSFDIRHLKEVEGAVKKLTGKWKNVDVLINNAGLASGLDDFHEASIEDWETMIDTNVKGLLYMSRLIAERMVKKKKGHIINICSTAGHEVYPKGNVYCATKHAVDAITRSMRLDLHSNGIRVSQVSPGATEETEFSLVRFKGDEKKAAIYDHFNPLTARDVANVIFFVASQPKHVNIQDVIMMGTQQASSTMFDKSGRKFD